MGAWIETGWWSKHQYVNWSPPSWGRGLKLALNDFAKKPDKVAPLVGAWIETIGASDNLRIMGGRPPRGGVD